MSTSPEPILTFVLRKLEEHRGQWVQVANASGVPYHTLTKIAQGQSPSPRIETVQRLVDYFNGRLMDGSATPEPEAKAA